MTSRDTRSRLRKTTRRLINKLFSKQRIHFIHIGKTGGSAITHVLKRHLTTGRYSIVIHSHNTKFRDIPASEKIIFFLRDPLTRFVSGFYSRQRQGQPRYLSPWSQEEKAIFERFPTPDQLARALSSSDEEEKRLAQFAMKSIVHVKDGYLDCFESPEYCRSRLADIFFVGFQEQLTEDFDSLKSKLRLPKDARLPTDSLHAHKNPEDLDKRLSDDAVRNLREWYRDDYEFIDFCKKVVLTKDQWLSRRSRCRS